MLPFQEALSLCEAIIALQPESAVAWFMKGKALFHLTEYLGALDALKAAIDLGKEGGRNTTHRHFLKLQTVSV